MAVGAGVGRGAVVSQGGVALTAVGRGEGDGTPKLTVRTGGRAERAGGRNEPTTCWCHRGEEDVREPGERLNSFQNVTRNQTVLTLRIGRLLVFNGIFPHVFVITSD